MIRGFFLFSWTRRRTTVLPTALDACSHLPAHLVLYLVRELLCFLARLCCYSGPPLALFPLLPFGGIRADPASVGRCRDHGQGFVSSHYQLWPQRGEGGRERWRMKSRKKDSERFYRRMPSGGHSSWPFLSLIPSTPSLYSRMILRILYFPPLLLVNIGPIFRAPPFRHSLGARHVYPTAALFPLTSHFLVF